MADFAKRMKISLEKVQELRYGENPHQSAALYRDPNAVEPGLPNAKQLHGKALSFNNILDLSAALRIVREFKEPACVVIKHGNPCGCACAKNIADALTEAWLGDPMSAFGSVISFNRIVDKKTAQRLGSTDYLKKVIVPRYRKESGDTKSEILAAFVEAVIAPGYKKDALEILQQKKNLRIMQLKPFNPRGIKPLDIRPVPGGYLVQEADVVRQRPSKFQVATKKKPTKAQLESLIFADAIAKHTKSNAIVLVKGKTLVGCGAGQMSRFDSTIIARRKAGKRAKGAVLASDAMFPAPDGLLAAAETGAVAVIQPGGSIRDDQVIAAANKKRIPMVVTKMRHFLH
jgi:phosphoribosylaminoimidazolecarboxamide formyltransferase/IMP cyclohydrolase